jgi:hypothetical protein
MKYRRRVFFTDRQKSEIWDRWQRGESMNSIGRGFALALWSLVKRLMNFRFRVTSSKIDCSKEPTLLCRDFYGEAWKTSGYAGDKRPNALAPLISRRFARQTLGLNNSWMDAFGLLQKRGIKW